MTDNWLVYVFFALFLLFLVESIYFLKKKLSVGPVDSINPENSQNNGKWILIGGLAVAAILIGSFGFLFFSRQKIPSANIALQITPTAIPTLIPSPTSSEVVFVFPTITGTLPTPTLVLIATTLPTKTPTLTKIPSPTATPKAKITSPTPTKETVIGGPSTVSPTSSPTKTESTSSAAVIVPKMPVAGSVGQTISFLILAISSVVIGLIL